MEMTTYCGECDSTVRYELSEDCGDWICTECGFAIDCTECGQTMSAEHEGAHA